MYTLFFGLLILISSGIFYLSNKNQIALKSPLNKRYRMIAIVLLLLGSLGWFSIMSAVTAVFSIFAIFMLAIGVWPFLSHWFTSKRGKLNG